MEKSQSIKAIAGALLKFHAAMGKITKDANNPFFKSKYASLSHIQEAISDPLNKSGLVYSQFPDGENGLTTILMHPESGEFIQSTNFMAPVKSDPQSLGSAITYSRRYALGAILGLNIDEDDDGNTASKPEAKKDYPKTDKQWLNPGTKEWSGAVQYIKGGGTLESIKAKYSISKVNEEKLTNETN